MGLLQGSSENSIDIVVALIGLFGIILGISVRYFFDDKIRPFFASRQTILNRLKDEKPLSKREKKRIRKYAENRLDEWRILFKSPNPKSNTHSHKKFLRLPYQATADFTSCPLSNDFLYFDSEKFVPGAIVASFENYLKSSDEVDHLSKKLFQLIKEKTNLVIWVRIPRYEFDTEEDLNIFYNQLEGIVKSWFPQAKLSLELFLPIYALNNVQQNIKVPTNFNNNPFFKIGKQCHLKDLYYTQLLSKSIVGNIKTDFNRSIPISLIKKRVNENDRLSDFRILKIYGPPGSGKSQTINYIIEKSIKDNEPYFIVCFNSHEILNDLNTYKNKYDSFIHFIINHIDLTELITYSENDLPIIKETLLWLLLSRRISLVLVLDNLEYSEKLYLDILSVINSRNMENIKFFLAGRYFGNHSALEPKELMTIKCDKWSIEESINILEEWNIDDDKINVIRNTWLDDDRQYSTYFLRIISLKDGNEKPDVLVKNEISEILKPVYKILSKVDLSQDEIRKHIEKLKEKDISKKSILKLFDQKKELDVIKTIGNIAWATLYYTSDSKGNRSNLNINLEDNPEKLIPWSQNRIPDIDTANDFIKACKDAHITVNSSFNLTDKLVQDGSAAIVMQEEITSYLIEEEQQEVGWDTIERREAVIHGMISTLAEKNSLEIFKLSFSARQLVAIIKTIIKSDRKKDILSKLLTDDYIHFLKHKPKEIEDLSMGLMNAFDNSSLSDNDQIHIARCIHKISKVDSQLSNYIQQVKFNNTNLYYCIVVLNDQSSIQIFDTCENIEDQSVLFGYCCLIWSEDSRTVMVDKLIELYTSSSINQNELMVNFMKWIKRSSDKNIISTIGVIINKIGDVDKTQRESCIIVLTKLFDYLYDNEINKNKSVKEMFLGYYDKWSTHFKQFYFDEVIQIKDIIHYLAFGCNPELWNRKSDFKILPSKDKKTIYVIPSMPFKTKKEDIQTIYSRFTNPKMFCLPTKKMLQHIVEDNYSEKELVSDYLRSKKINYVPFPKMFPINFKYYFEGELQGLTAENSNKLRFLWRAVFII